MALILKNKTYLKIDLSGNYIIYKTRAARAKMKKAPTFEEITNKYAEIIDSLKASITPDQRYYAPNVLIETIVPWEQERDRYLQDYQNKNKSNTYPLISQYLENVEDSIAEVVENGRINISANSLKEMYEKLKKYEIFGKVEDMRDA